MPETVRRFPGAERVLAAHAPALPQPDQQCGPFAAAAALQAVLAPGPTVAALALASGTAIWPHDVPEWRPAGAPVDTTGWEDLPRADGIEDSGTDATGLAAGLGRLVGDRVSVVPARGSTPRSLRTLFDGLLRASYDVGVVANLRTGPVLEGTGHTWDVGHFVVLYGVTDDRARVAVADSYRELGTPGAPPGCRLVDLDALCRALEAPPGRGLLLLVRTDDSPAATDLVVTSGLSNELWSA